MTSGAAEPPQLIVDGAPVAVRGRATPSRSRCCGPASIPAVAAASAWPATARNCLVRGRRRRLRARLPDAGPATAPSSSATRARGAPPVPRAGRRRAVGRRATCTATSSWSARGAERAGGGGAARARRVRTRGRARRRPTATEVGRHLRRAARSSCARAERHAARPLPTRSSSRPAPPSCSRSCPGAELAGLYTARAADALTAAGLRWAARCASRAGCAPGAVRGRRAASRPSSCAAADGAERRHEATPSCSTSACTRATGSSRQGAGLAVRTVGEAAAAGALPPARPPTRRRLPLHGHDGRRPRLGLGARASARWSSLKRATLAGTGTCQGGACLPHLRAFLAARGGRDAAAVHGAADDAADHDGGGRRRRASSRPSGAPRWTASTARSARGWSGSAAGGGRGRTATRPPSTAAVREAVSIGDVSTLGKVLVSGPDAVRVPGADLPVPRRRPRARPHRATRCCWTSAAT